MEDIKKDEVVVEDEVVVIDELTQRDEEIAKLKDELNNYKNVALKRLGKLPGDVDFIEEDSSKTGLTIEEIVKRTLLDREITKKEQEKEQEMRRIIRENTELKLSLKNKPGNGVGSDSGQGNAVKDNTFSQVQLDSLNARAKLLKLDPVKFIEKTKINLTRSR